MNFENETYQYWHMTNVDPPIPMKNLNTVKPVALFTNPVSAVGHALQNKMIPIGILGPNLSQKGPSTNRMTIVPTDAAMDDVQISESLSCNVF